MTQLLQIGISLSILTLSFGAMAAGADRPAFVFPEGCCYYQGDIVRTVVPPSSDPHEGRDNFYAVSGGAEGQKGVIGVAPGDVGYHGGHWAFHLVQWSEDVAPYLLTSESAVLDAQATGDVSVTRDAEMDFRCPIQP